MFFKKVKLLIIKISLQEKVLLVIFSNNNNKIIITFEKFLKIKGKYKANKSKNLTNKFKKKSR